MPKEKSINPAQAQRKAEKAKAVKKGKAEAQTRRTEKLARRNPERLQTQLSSLLAIESSGTKLTAHEVRLKEELEKDLKAVRKARETLGDKAPAFGRGGGDREGGRDRGGDRDGGRGGGVLGKRRRDGGWGGEESESDVPEEVAGVPMPRDTPPPIPKEVLDKWYQARRDKWAANNPQQAGRGEGRGGEGSSANAMPLGANAREVGTGGREEERRVPKAPPVEAKTVYEAAPAIRDLRREAVSAFVPAAVRRKLEMAGGRGGLVGEGEAEELERGGYWKGGGGEGDGGEGGKGKEVEGKGGKGVTMEEVEDEDAR
ncbi:hypothetical protein VE02_09714 [Pseudogymnoascus sp. 03VT05]|nr:hypothetical protein VE02_09714 [Pseudogymnoascus sp. 03VT05]